MKKILNGRILASLAIILFVGAGAVGATGAFFSDTETSTGNTFAAGELDLTIDNSSYGIDCNIPSLESCTGEFVFNPANSWEPSDLDGEFFFSFRDLKPGDYGEDTISLHVQNDAWACMAMDLTSTPDNGINEPEDDAGDITDGALGGELQNYLNFIFWRDDGDNVFGLGEESGILFEGSAGKLDGDWQTIADSGFPPPLATGETYYVGKFWCFGEIGQAPLPDREDPNTQLNNPANRGTGFTCDGTGGHNDAQTDGIIVDVHFYSEQSRNNGEFLCAELPRIPEETIPTSAARTPPLQGPVSPPGPSFAGVRIVGQEVGQDKRMQLSVNGNPVGPQFDVDSFFDITYEIDIDPVANQINIELVPLTLGGVPLPIPVSLPLGAAQDMATRVGVQALAPPASPQVDIEIVELRLQSLQPIAILPPFAPGPELSVPVPLDIVHMDIGPFLPTPVAGFEMDGGIHAGNTPAIDSFFDVFVQIDFAP